MKFEKAWLSYGQQADLLMKERGLITDRENPIRHLKETGYYRLSGYWLITLNTVRNICAHHGRPWDRGIGTRPIIPTAKKYPEWHEPFPIRYDNLLGILTILGFLLEHVAPDTSWRTKLLDPLSSRSTDELDRMGFTRGWKESPLWKPWVKQYDENKDTS